MCICRFLHKNQSKLERYIEYTDEKIFFWFSFFAVGKSKHGKRRRILFAEQNPNVLTNQLVETRPKKPNRTVSKNESLSPNDNNISSFDLPKVKNSNQTKRAKHENVLKL